MHGRIASAKGWHFGDALCQDGHDLRLAIEQVPVVAGEYLRVPAGLHDLFIPGDEIEALYGCLPHRGFLHEARIEGVGALDELGAERVELVDGQRGGELARLHVQG